ncbi:unnamed protein product [Larinioides sclopetarius]|uniref:Uncharacterized protein n=1 Tax=Larinioides sclopetarius TaxID=280406 RepID=A0AAV1Z2I7_9ARAC
MAICCAVLTRQLFPQNIKEQASKLDMMPRKGYLSSSTSAFSDLTILCSLERIQSNFKGLPSNQQIAHCGSQGKGLCYCGLCAYFTDKHPRNDTLLTIVLWSVSRRVEYAFCNRTFFRYSPGPPILRFSRGIANEFNPMHPDNFEAFYGSEHRASNFEACYMCQNHYVFKRPHLPAVFPWQSTSEKKSASSFCRHLVEGVVLVYAPFGAAGNDCLWRKSSFFVFRNGAGIGGWI